MNLGKITHSYSSEITAPTCTTGGYTTHTCTVCGDTYKDSETELLDHNLEIFNSSSATCTENGFKNYKCTRCDYTTSEIIESAGHKYESVMTEATCESEGYTTHTCTVCNDSYIDNNISPLGHDFKFNDYVESTTYGAININGTCSRCSSSTTKPAVATRQKGSSYRYYHDLITAIKDTTSGLSDNVLLFSSYCLENGLENNTLIIPNNITLVITWLDSPCSSEAGTVYEDKDYNLSGEKTYVHNKDNYIKTILTIEKNIEIIVNGKIILHGMLGQPNHGLSGHTSGNHVQIHNAGTIILENNSILDVRGYIIDGTIIAKSGSSIYAPFVVKDYAAEMNTIIRYAAHKVKTVNYVDGLSNIPVDKGICPFNLIEMPNINSELTVNYGAKYYGYASLYSENNNSTLNSLKDIIKDLDLNGFNLVTTNIAGPSNEFLFQMSDNATIKFTESNNINTIDFINGTIYLNSLSMTIMNQANVSMANVFFGVSYLYNIIINKDCVFNLNSLIKLLPNTKISIQGTLNVNSGGNIILYDANDMNSDSYYLKEYQNIFGKDIALNDAELVIEKTGNVYIAENAAIGGLIKGNEGAKIHFSGSPEFTQYSFEGINKGGSATGALYAASLVDGCITSGALKAALNLFSGEDSIILIQNYIREKAKISNEEFFNSSGEYVYNNGKWNLLGSYILSFDYQFDDILFNVTYSNSKLTSSLSQLENFDTKYRPEKIGYTFEGWYMDKDLSDDQKLDLNNIYSNTMLYAKWKANEYDIIYNLNGGKIVNDIYPTIHTYGKNTVLPDAYKEGYKFIGWYLSSSLNENGASSHSTLLGADYTNDISLYARWESPDFITYKVNFHDGFTNDDFTITLEDSTGEGVNLYSGNAPIDDDYQLKSDRYQFDGWYYSDGTKYIDQTINCETNLYARWIYTVKLNYNESTTDIIIIEIQNSNKDKDIVVETKELTSVDYNYIWFTNNTHNSSVYYKSVNNTLTISIKEIDKNNWNKEVTLYGEEYYIMDYSGNIVPTYNNQTSVLIIGKGKEVPLTAISNEFTLSVKGGLFSKYAELTLGGDFHKSPITNLILENCNIYNGTHDVKQVSITKRCNVYIGVFTQSSIKQVIATNSYIGYYAFGNCGSAKPNIILTNSTTGTDENGIGVYHTKDDIK